MKTYLYGVHAIATALDYDPGNILQILYSEQSLNSRIQKIIADAEKQGISATAVNPKTLQKHCQSTHHQGIIAEYAGVKSWSENDISQLLKDIDKPLLLLLDGVTDPHNLGACLRTAEAAGVNAVITPKNNAVGITPTVRKVASGAAELVPVIHVTNLSRTMESLKKMGIWLIGTSDQASQTLYAQDFTAPTALVMGAEGKGLRKNIEKHCDALVSIPMSGKVSSLNVSVATGVCLYEIIRQRTHQ